MVKWIGFPSWLGDADVFLLNKAGKRCCSHAVGIERGNFKLIRRLVHRIQRRRRRTCNALGLPLEWLVGLYFSGANWKFAAIYSSTQPTIWRWV